MIKKINWWDHLVNLVVVIVGITIAFGLNKCSESKKLGSEKEAIILSLLSDLEEDIATFQQQLKEDSLSLEAIQLLRKSRNTNVSDDSLLWALSKFAELSTFTGNNVTYEGIKNSNNLNYFELELRNKLVQYYLLDYNSIAEREKYLIMNFDEQIVPNMTQAFDIEKQQIMRSFLNEDSFRHTLNLHLSFITQRMEAYSAALKDAKALKLILKR